MDAPARRSRGGDDGGKRAGRAGAVTALARRPGIALALAAFAAAILPLPAAAPNPPATAPPKSPPGHPKSIPPAPRNPRSPPPPGAPHTKKETQMPAGGRGTARPRQPPPPQITAASPIS